ncbi:MAG: hypothetical protein WA539_13630, partial [Candidatus Sulfotelmatobacter sp.]
RTVILSEVSASPSEALMQSKHPFYAGACPRQQPSSHSVLASLRASCGKALLVSAILFLLTSLAASQTLTGTVKNATTGKPAVGDDVVLLKLAQGMEEAGRTQTDAGGHFSLKLDDLQAPHLIRVIHQDVTYHQMVPPATTSVNVDVFDVAKKIEGIQMVADIMRLEVVQGQLEIVREFGVQNSSDPPRTQMNEHNLEFYIPEGAQIIEDSATATTQNGNPLKSAPVPEAEKNRYSFIFPLRPGLTRFEVAYQLPYTGSANVDPKSLYSLQHFVVMIPKTMQFAAAAKSAGFKLIDYPNEPGASVQVTSNTTPHENLAFRVSGEGTLAASQEGGAQGSGGGSAPPESAQTTDRPGGGLGPPIDAPDPLQQYRWWILGSFAAVLIIGGVYVASRQQSAARALAHQKSGSSNPAALEEDDYAPAEIPPTRPASRARPTSMLLEGLKEELFQLEVERRQGQISPTEYEKAKAALDQTLERALQREARKA